MNVVDPTTLPRIVEQFDPVAGSWSVADFPPLLSGVAGHGAAAFGGSVYVAAGVDEDVNLHMELSGTPYVEAYDGRSGAWQRIPALLLSRAQATAAVAKGCLVTAGGWNDSPPYCQSEAELLDSTTQSWVRIPDLAQGRAGAAIAVVDEKVYVLGGWQFITTESRPALSSVEVLS